MIKYSARLIFIFLLVQGFCSDSYAQFSIHGNFSAGGMFSSNNNYTLYQIAGQTFVGTSVNDVFQIQSGIFQSRTGALTGVDNLDGSIPISYSISQNYPNPFNPATKIKYALPESGLVKIFLYDVLGRQLKSLVNEEQNAGYHEINFNAGDLSSGVYFYNIIAGDFVQTKKMILMK